MMRGVLEVYEKQTWADAPSGPCDHVAAVRGSFGKLAGQNQILNV